MIKKMLFLLLISAFIAGCNGLLICPMNYEVNIRAFDKKGKPVWCDLKTINKVNRIVSKIAAKFDYSCPQESAELKEYPQKAFSATCFYVTGDDSRKLCFWDKEFRIEIRGNRKDYRLGEKILEALKREFPNYIFKFDPGIVNVVTRYPAVGEL